MKLYIFGAGSIALGVYKAIKSLSISSKIQAFLVTSLKKNPRSLAGIPVIEVESLTVELKQEDIEKVHILIATPPNLHKDIITYLNEYGFEQYTCMTPKLEMQLMEEFLIKDTEFTILKTLQKGLNNAILRVFEAQFYKDEILHNRYIAPIWVNALQVGADIAPQFTAKYIDNSGQNISFKNPNYCELTGLYWIWKNQLPKAEADYYGLFHYRRILDISDDDILRLKGNDVDVILPYPTIHEPDIKEHHTRYVQESDWKAMLQALQELEPEYAEAYHEIFAQEYMYNYNILVAKREVLEDYCAWLFPILERTEELSVPKGSERADRYIGYLGENLLTLYFMYNRNELKIVHTGRIMLT